MHSLRKLIPQTALPGGPLTTSVPQAISPENVMAVSGDKANRGGLPCPRLFIKPDPWMRALPAIDMNIIRINMQ